MKLRPLALTQRNAMAAYIADRAGDVRPPVEVLDGLQNRFRVISIRTGVPGKEAAVLRPVVGGFRIQTRIPRTQGRDLRYVIAHEFAHTYFYKFSSENAPPHHVGDAWEESLCNLGARELLLPRRRLATAIWRDCRLEEVYRVADRCDAHPQWVAARFLVDWPTCDGWFCVYSQQGRRIQKAPNSEVSSAGVYIDRTMQAQVRRLVVEHAVESVALLNNVLLRSGVRSVRGSMELWKDPGGARLLGDAHVVAVLMRIN